MKIDKIQLHNDFVFKRREIEKAKGIITFNEIAEEIGVSRTSIWRAFKEDNGHKLETIVKICRWLGKPIDNYIID